MRLPPPFLWISAVLITALAITGYFTRETWMAWISASHPEKESDQAARPSDEPKMLKLTPQARKNLNLIAQPVKLQSYWRSIQVPGVIVDRPGHSDRVVTAPAAGVIAKIHAFPGDTVKSGDRLVTLRLIGEQLQSTQSELLRTTREVQIVKKQRGILGELAKTGLVQEPKLIELDSQLLRFEASIQAYRQDLLTRGLTRAQIDGISEGKFVSEIDVHVPPLAEDHRIAVSVEGNQTLLGYEVEELKVELGQQVNAGNLLCLLAHHHSLYIEGRSFKREAPWLEKAAANGWPVRVEFPEEESDAWPTLNSTFTIRHLANTVDPDSRTFAFFVPLTNQARSYEKEGRTLLVWRFRPGQRVRLHVPVEEFKDVFVLPAGAVVRDGAEAYAFVQNGDLFQRRPVHVVHEDRLNVVLANDGAVRAGVHYLAQGAAASLNRILKAQHAAGGLPPGAHFHADGSLHIPGK
ncbi:MAG: efflux RND transporter periplasmic adaptor subunit [Gemmataceae bacterium]|nr:efflux RND transporter periplasmic adaptor subunit [Gemmataceae bacterium]MCI0738740.1 efflux RND transporter periplasmic adaptor subunit [Gemmataceae bacterium]